MGIGYVSARNHNSFGGILRATLRAEEQWGALFPLRERAAESRERQTPARERWPKAYLPSTDTKSLSIVPTSRRRNGTYARAPHLVRDQTKAGSRRISTASQALHLPEPRRQRRSEERR